MPVHYYSSVPSIKELKKTKKSWINRSDMVGVEVKIDKQVENLLEITKSYQLEFEGNKNYLMGQKFGLGFGFIDAQALHCIIRYYKPRQIIEIGSGVSTYCMLKALELNVRTKSKLISIDPNPFPPLINLKNNTNRFELIEEICQIVDLEIFLQLKENDILFIDSSHAVKTGSDVNFIFLEILPRLNKGVIIHFHDIYFPYDYQRVVLKTYFNWSETTLLHAFLKFNSKFEIIFCLSHLHYDYPKILKKCFPEYNPQFNDFGLEVKKYDKDKHFPASIYLKVL